MSTLAADEDDLGRANAGDNLLLMRSVAGVTDTLRGVENIVFLVGGSAANPRGEYGKQSRTRACEIGATLVKIGNQIMQNEQLLAQDVLGVCTENKKRNLCCVYNAGS
jgi:hypothetical protein